MGNAFPRFSARRRIPAHAFELKKYCGGIEPLTSTCDNDDTTASLGQAEILGVSDSPRDCSFGSKHNTSVRPPTPWRFERHVFAGKSAKEATEGVILGCENARHVLPVDDAGVVAMLGASLVDGISEIHK